MDTNINASCPICQQTDLRFLRPVGPVTLHYCRSCHVRFSFPMRHPGQAWYEDSDIYDEVRWNLPHLGKLGSRWEFAMALREINAPQAKLFDIGCGRGDFLKLAQAKGFTTYGIDLNATLIRMAKEAYGLEGVEQSFFEDYVARNSDKKFDAVTAFEVLEHLPEPHEFVEGCKKLLPEGGKLILSVPGYHRFPHWVNSDVDLPPHHLILWSEPGLRQLLERHGFKNISVHKKPLLLTDVMYHAVRLMPGLQKPGFIPKAMRGVLKLCVLPFWQVLRLFPRAGGFTYLACGVK